MHLLRLYYMYVGLIEVVLNIACWVEHYSPVIPRIQQVLQWGKFEICIQ